MAAEAEAILAVYTLEKVATIVAGMLVRKQLDQLCAKEFMVGIVITKMGHTIVTTIA